MSPLKFNEKGIHRGCLYPYRECNVIDKIYTYFVPKSPELKPEKTNEIYKKQKNLKVLIVFCSLSKGFN